MLEITRRVREEKERGKLNRADEFVLLYKYCVEEYDSYYPERFPLGDPDPNILKYMRKVAGDEWYYIETIILDYLHSLKYYPSYAVNLYNFKTYLKELKNKQVNDITLNL